MDEGQNACYFANIGVFEPLAGLLEFVEPVVVDVSGAVLGVCESDVKPWAVTVYEALEGGDGVGVVPCHLDLLGVIGVDFEGVAEVVDCYVGGGKRGF